MEDDIDQQLVEKFSALRLSDDFSSERKRGRPGKSLAADETVTRECLQERIISSRSAPMLNNSSDASVRGWQGKKDHCLTSQDQLKSFANFRLPSVRFTFAAPTHAPMWPFECRTYPERARLMNLPRELRDMIWEYILKDLKISSSMILRSPLSVKNGPPPATYFPALIPAFCYISRQIFNETIPFFLKNREIILGSQTDVTRLRSVLDSNSDDEAYHQIRTVVFEEGVRWNSQLAENASSFIQKCGSLVDVTIEVDAWRLITVRDRRGLPSQEFIPFHRLCTKNEALREVDLRPLLHCHRLKRVNLICASAELHQGPLQCTAEDLFEHLVAWLKEHVGSRRNVFLEIDYKANWELEKAHLPSRTGWVEWK